MILYVRLFPAEEYAFSNLYEDYPHLDCQVEMPDEDYEKMIAVEVERAAWQEKLAKLVEKSTRSDKR